MKSGRVLFYQMTILFCFAHPSPVSRKIVMAAIMDFLRARRKTLNFKGWGEKNSVPAKRYGTKWRPFLFFFTLPPFREKSPRRPSWIFYSRGNFELKGWGEKNFVIFLSAKKCLDFLTKKGRGSKNKNPLSSRESVIHITRNPSY
jgi:hypothetical protein